MIADHYRIRFNPIDGWHIVEVLWSGSHRLVKGGFWSYSLAEEWLSDQILWRRPLP